MLKSLRNVYQNNFKRGRKSNISNGIRTVNLSGDKGDKYLKGEIIIDHCRGQDAIKLFFHIRGFYKQEMRLLSENYYFR